MKITVIANFSYQCSNMSVSHFANSKLNYCGKVYKPSDLAYFITKSGKYNYLEQEKICTTSCNYM